MRAPRRTATAVVTPLLAVALCAALAGVLGGKSGGEAAKALEDSVRDACSACYAIEGRYPPDLEYLKRNYGLMVDEDKYLVYYQAFAPNVPPQVRLWEVSP